MNAPNQQFHGDTPMRWHVAADETGGALTVGEAWVRPGSEPPLHIHAREDETWYIIEGSVLFQRGVERIECGPGQSIVLPRGIPHGFAVQSQAARILHIYTPGGLESAFESLSGPEPAPIVPAEAEAIFGDRGVTFVGPPLPVILASERKQVAS